MIKGLHAMFYSSEPEAFRAFVRDKLRFSHADVGVGWLLFKMPEADLGCHPTGEEAEDGKPSGTADISFYCEDIAATTKELRSRGVEFIGEVEDHGYGLVIFFKMPGDVTVQLYQPRYTRSWEQ